MTRQKFINRIGFIFETRLVRTGESFLFDSSKYYQIYDKIK